MKYSIKFFLNIYLGYCLKFLMSLHLTRLLRFLPLGTTLVSRLQTRFGLTIVTSLVVEIMTCRL